MSDERPVSELPFPKSSISGRLTFPSEFSFAPDELSRLVTAMQMKRPYERVFQKALRGLG
jgi:hypothetical protein|eukprot:COSAG01_NODE_6302_length_3746_cov_35.050727_2_plen_60_part_00